jgi:hypothetical protein
MECDKPKPGKPLSTKERQSLLDKNADLMRKLWDVTVNSKATGDEITLEIIYHKPIGSPALQVKREVWFVKRSGEKLYVTASRDWVGVIVYMLDLARPDADDPTVKSTVEHAEKLTETAPGKCKAL